MNLSLLDKKVIQLINQYSIGGNLTSFSDGTIKDYLLRHRNLIDACQKEISNIFPIVKELEYVQSHNDNTFDFVSYALPVTCDNVIDVKLKAYPHFSSIPYHVKGNNILISPLLVGTIIIYYSKLPDDINDSTAETTELEIYDVLQELVPYYVAGHVYLEDNPTVGTMLLNEYEQKLHRIKSRPLLGQAKVNNGWGW